ncbi:hypothetical protein [Niabella sp.]|uniref:hypothetical protein n=1 Tax=Niabella sp. TaxID=1962976 RepID=UPI00262E1E95|nr:hypothetical protein [Niabella sp.]
MSIVDKIATIGLLIVCLAACDPATVTFSETQPGGEPALGQVPDSLTGTFLDHDKGTVLAVSAYYVVARDTLSDTLSYRELLPHEMINGDTLFNTQTNERYPVRKAGDSLFTGYVFRDTLLNLKKNDVLKTYQQQYFLNRPREDSSWSVQKLTVRNGVLNIRKISTKNEVKMMEAITGAPSDSAKPLRVSPGKEALSEFIKEGGFINGRTFIRKRVTVNSEGSIPALKK